MIKLNKLQDFSDKYLSGDVELKKLVDVIIEWEKIIIGERDHIQFAKENKIRLLNTLIDTLFQLNKTEILEELGKILNGDMKKNE